MMDKAELTSQLQERYKDIKKPEVRAVIKIQDEILSSLRDYLRVQMLKDGTTPSAGFGISVERLTRYICGKEFIWDSVPFPKVPGIVSP